MKKHIKTVIIAAVTLLVAATTAFFANTTFQIAPVDAADAADVDAILAAGAFKYAQDDVLVDTAWVQENGEADGIHLIDVGSNILDYEAGHIPGAVFANIRTELVNPDSSVQGVIPTQEQFEAVLGTLGVTAEDTVVLYDSRSNLYAARAYWVFKYYQHEDVRIYNGGTIKWKADGNRLILGRETAEPVDYVAGEPDPTVYADYQQVLDSLDDENVVTCDTRTDGEFAGEDIRADRGGHIPGTTHLEWVHAVNEDGTFKAAPELAALFYAEGLTPDKEILTYCQTGVRSAHTWFVLTELLGYPNVRNYDGSWIEWANNTDLPITE
ncbi:MAG: sulfurtransferase [Chloroflexota bacterium]